MPQTLNKGYHHFVWATWDREPLLTGDVERHAYALIRQQCSLLKAELHALGGIADHIHLLVTLPMTLCSADFMEAVKGASARTLNTTHGSPAWAFKWQGGYSYFTVCASHVSTVASYIENQKRHHAEGRLWPPVSLRQQSHHRRESVALRTLRRPRRRAGCFSQPRGSALGIYVPRSRLSCGSDSPKMLGKSSSMPRKKQNA